MSKYQNFIQIFKHDKPEDNIVIEHLPNGVSLRDIVAFDIETTGTDPSNSKTTIMSFTFFDDNMVLQTMQFFLVQKEFEEEMYKLFERFLKTKSYIITFNGDSFDLPYVDHKLAENNIPIYTTKMDGIDIYKWAKRYQSAAIKIQRNQNIPENKLKKPFGDRLTLKAIEQFAGINREDTIHGVTMIEKYHEYEFYYKTSLITDEKEFKIRIALIKDEKAFEIYKTQGMDATRKYLSEESIRLRDDLMLHNREDTYNLLKLYGILSPKIYHN